MGRRPISARLHCSESELALIPSIVGSGDPGRLELDSCNSKRLISDSKPSEDVAASGTGEGGRFLVVGSLAHRGTYLGASPEVYSVLQGNWLDSKNSFQSEVHYP